MPATTTGSPFALSVPSASTDLADLFGTYLKPNMATINTYAAHKSTAQTFTALQTFSAAIAVTGNSTITGTLGGLTGLTVASGGASITGNSTIAGTLGGITGLTVASGGITVTSGDITANGSSPVLNFAGSSGTPYIRLQATNGLIFQNAAASASLIYITNAGAMTIAAGLTVTTGGAAITGALTNVTTIAASSTITGTAHVSTGLTGATTQVRYVGGVTGSTAPSSGTFALGDVVVGTGGVVFICTTAGTPGTWTSVGAASSTATFRWSFLLGGM